MNPLLHEMFQTARVLTKELNDELHQYGLYHTQWSILYCLKQNGPLSISAISKYFNVEAPTISRTVSRLEQLGWVERREGKDKREIIVFLTDNALLEVGRISDSVIHFEQGVTDRLSAQEQEILRGILSKIKIER